MKEMKIVFAILLCVQRIVKAVVKELGMVFHNGAPKQIWQWRRHRVLAYTVLLETYSERESVRRFQILPTTFKFIVVLVDSEMKNDARDEGIEVWHMIVVVLNRLETWNYITRCDDLYGISEGFASIIVREFCAILVRIRIPLFVPKWTTSSLEEFASRFEKIHGFQILWGL